MWSKKGGVMWSCDVRMHTKGRTALPHCSSPQSRIPAGRRLPLHRNPPQQVVSCSLPTAPSMKLVAPHVMLRSCGLSSRNRRSNSLQMPVGGNMLTLRLWAGLVCIGSTFNNAEFGMCRVGTVCIPHS